MHYGEFRTGYFLSAREREARCDVSDTSDAISRKPAPVGSSFPLQLALALAGIAVATITFGLWHV